jgi:hypothetical protein
MTRCHYCGETVPAAPADESKGIATLHACAAAMTAIGKQHGELLTQIADDVRIMLASSTELVDGLGNVTGYQIKTGALHRIIGRLVCAGHPVTIPAIAHRASHLGVKGTFNPNEKPVTGEPQ